MEPRDASRLLVLSRRSGQTWQLPFRALLTRLQAGDLLVLNETRVLPARLLTRLARTDRQIEVLLSHPEDRGWIALLGPGRRLKPGDRLTLEEGEGSFVLVAPLEGGRWRLEPEGPSAEEMMERSGHVPLPPYLGRPDQAEDRNWYQTVFAQEAGAVAAPTAGLHFTVDLLRELEARGIGVTKVVLHVGPGTFLPVRSASPKMHRVLPERFDITESAAFRIARARRGGGRVVAVGTTVVRALETAALETGAVQAGQGWTDLTIVPGFPFRAVDTLLTNFHLPRSSLLLLVSAFAGREPVLEAYREAVEAGFRFYSYGDAMLIL